MEEKKKRLVAVAAVVLSLAALGFAVNYSMSESGETHRELKEVPPKGAGKNDRE
jgi:hypothetical protein